MNTNQKEVYVITQEVAYPQRSFNLTQVIGIYSSSKKMNETMSAIQYKMVNECGFKEVPEEASAIANFERRDYGISRRVWVSNGIFEYRFTAYKRVMNETWMAL